MKNTFLLIVLLLFINYSFSLKEAKEFFIEFLKTTKNAKILKNLSKKCFGEIFDYHFLLLQKSFKENNFEKIYQNHENMILDTIVNCPINELISIFKNNEYGIFSPLALKFRTKIYSKLLTLASNLYIQINNNTLTAVSLGKTMGQYYNLMKFDYNALYELESEDEEENDDIILLLDTFNNQLIELFKGIFIGMKDKNDGKDSKCYKDIIKGKKQLMNIIETGMQKMKEGKNLKEVITNLSFQLVAIEGLTVDCNLLNLGNSLLGKLTSYKEMYILLNKIMKNSKLYISFITQIIKNFEKKNVKEVGKYIGKIISNIFDFTVQ